MDQTLVVIILSTMIIAAAVTFSTILAPLLVRRRRTITRTVTVLKCPSCNLELKRPYRKPEYIGMKTQEKCPKCGMELLVYAIYEESPKRKTRKTQTLKEKG